MNSRHIDVERCPACKRVFDVEEIAPAATAWQGVRLFFEGIPWRIPGGGWFRVLCPFCEQDFLSFRLKYFGWFSLLYWLVFLGLLVVVTLGVSVAVGL